MPTASKSLKVLPLSDLTDDEKVQLLEALNCGYGYDGQRVTQFGLPYADPYSGHKVTLADLAILPGSAIVIGNNPISIAGYAADYLTSD